MPMRTGAWGWHLMTHLDEFFDGLPPRLDIKQVATLLGVSDKGVYAWLKEGVIPGYKVGRTWIVLRDELKAVMAAGRNSADTEPADTEPPSQ